MEYIFAFGRGKILTEIHNTGPRWIFNGTKYCKQTQENNSLPANFQFTSGLHIQFRGELFYRMVLERTPYPDLFILSVPKSRSRRSTTAKPRTAILKRLESEFKIQEVEAQEILSRQKRDFINPKAKRNRYLSDDQDSR